MSAILGVLLAVTFVAGTFIAIDSSARATLDASLAGIPGDFSFTFQTFDSTFNYTTLEDAILGTAGVVDVSIYQNLPVSNIENTTAPPVRSGAALRSGPSESIPSVRPP